MQHGSNLMTQLTNNAMLDEAMVHIYKRSENNSHNSDIWSFHTNWATHRHLIREQLLDGCYQLSPVQSFNTPDAGRLTRWSAADAVVLKAFALVLGPLLDSHVDQRCTHLKGRGGLKGAGRALSSNIDNFRHVCKSDVASFYDSMNHDIVMQHAKAVITDKRCLNLLYQYLNRVEVLHGDHRLIERGIPKGCPLSPLMGGLLLKSLGDSIMKDCFYVRYMDDWVVLTKTRRQLRRVIKKMHQVMDRLKFKLALDKTFIGPIRKGLDFLGYRFSHQGIIGLAQKTLSNFKERLSTLYERGTSSQRIAQYVRNWMRWCISGVPVMTRVYNS